jgi:hypothetical protein
MKTPFLMQKNSNMYKSARERKEGQGGIFFRAGKQSFHKVFFSKIQFPIFFQVYGLDGRW